MSLHLPPANHPARERFDRQHLVEVAHPSNRQKLPTVRQAVNSARQMLKDGSAVAVFTFCLNAEGDLKLIRVNWRGGVSTVWNFGTL